jgi:hypothetical protein
MSQRRSLDHLRKVPTILGREVVYIGVIEGRDNYVVHGRVEGNCDLDGVLLIGPDCLWVGSRTYRDRQGSCGGIHANFKVEVRRVRMSDLPAMIAGEGAVLGAGGPEHIHRAPHALMAGEREKELQF